MQLSNIPKLLILLAFSSAIFTGCGSASDQAKTPGPPSGVERAEPPYANAEPDVYQTEITVTDGPVIERFLAVREGPKWRITTGYGMPTEVVSLRTDKDYVLSPAKKTYVDYQSGHGYDERARMVEEITRGMINARTNAVFEKVGTTAGVTKYRKWGEAGKDLVSIVSVDDKIGLPVKMEIFKNGETTAKPDVTVELVNFKKQTDPALLEIPKDYKLVPIEDMRKQLIAAP